MEWHRTSGIGILIPNLGHVTRKNKLVNTGTLWVCHYVQISKERPK